MPFVNAGLEACEQIDGEDGLRAPSHAVKVALVDAGAAGADAASATLPTEADEDSEDDLPGADPRGSRAVDQVAALLNGDIVIDVDPRDGPACHFGKLVSTAEVLEAVGVMASPEACQAVSEAFKAARFGERAKRRKVISVLCQVRKELYVREAGCRCGVQPQHAVRP